MTVEQQRIEMAKCKADPVYFYEKYWTVNGQKPQPLTDVQKDIMRMLNKQDTLILYKGSGRGAINNALVIDIKEHVK